MPPSFPSVLMLGCAGARGGRAGARCRLASQGFLLFAHRGARAQGQPACSLQGLALACHCCPLLSSLVSWRLCGGLAWACFCCVARSQAFSQAATPAAAHRLMLARLTRVERRAQGSPGHPQVASSELAPWVKARLVPATRRRAAAPKLHLTARNKLPQAATSLLRKPKSQSLGVLLWLQKVEHLKQDDKETTAWAALCFSERWSLAQGSSGL